MFGFARRLSAAPTLQTVAIQPPPTPPGPARPAPLRLVRDDETILTEYEQIADGLNFHPSELFERRVRNFLIEEDIPIYAYRDVFDYMARLCRKVQKGWEWAPLEHDHLTAMALISSDLTTGQRFDTDADPNKLRGGGFRVTAYSRLVPVEHLKNAKRIRDKFGGKVQFYVSDFAVPNPDPFICVHWLGLAEPIVFGVWDEPGFGG